MSRSSRKTPIVPMATAVSEKQDKRLSNRALRLAARHAVRMESELMPIANNVSNIATMDKDGKRYIDAQKWPKAMRK